VYENVNRSVVNISTQSVSVDNFFMRATPAEGAGSGAVFDKRGHILTNFHVVEGARRIEVTMHDGKSFDAKLVGRDPSTDLAILKIDAPADALVPVVMGNSGNLRVGQKVLAIGNPFGLERTLTVGIVSSLNRSLPTRGGRTIKSMIQTDAAINPGNSGGPLLDSQGRVVGLNTAIASRTGQNTGVGFAIPINMIARIVPQLIEVGRVVRPDIGIERVYETDAGLLIASVDEDGPAEQAGLSGFRIVRERVRRGPVVYERQRIDRSSADLISAIDGRPVRSVDDLLTVIEEKRPGDTVEVTLIRDGNRQTAKVTLGEDRDG
ncbi:MAG: trypsin-like peptidase domain-containing protein, partial [Pirellulales bacterium]|nr:trypsin-like peptidase domain-containing protein [Pirellulales bacterium]